MKPLLARGVFYCFFGLLLSACVNTQLAVHKLEPSVLKLQDSNTRNIYLHMKESSENTSLGHQFLFILFPVGRIQHQNPKAAILQEATTRLALSGFRVFESTDSSDYPLLNLSITSLQLSAYDFIFFRKIVCKIKLRAELWRRSSMPAKVWETSQSTHDYRALAFEPQLDHLFTSTLQASVVEALSEIGLYSGKKNP